MFSDKLKAALRRVSQEVAADMPQASAKQVAEMSADMLALNGLYEEDAEIRRHVGEHGVRSVLDEAKKYVATA